MSQYQLTTELLKSSVSVKWDEAKLEWELIDIEKLEDPETCLCGHFPILEVCTIQNTKTKKTERVGNCCVKKFNNKSDKIFRAIAKIKKTIERSVNSETLELARKKRLISEKEYTFCIDILRKKKLSDKQLQWKISINKKLVFLVKASNSINKAS